MFCATIVEKTSELISKVNNLWPLELITIIDGVLLKLRANCPGGGEFTLSVNETDFQKIPYLSAQLFSSLQEAENEEEEEDKAEILGCINLNGDALYEGGSMPLNWSTDNCKVLVNAKIGQELVKSIEVYDLDCHPKTANELL